MVERKMPMLVAIWSGQTWGIGINPNLDTRSAFNQAVEMVLNTHMIRNPRLVDDERHGRFSGTLISYVLLNDDTMITIQTEHPGITIRRASHAENTRIREIVDSSASTDSSESGETENPD